MTPKLDIIVMLLSSDWFFEKWSLLGLDAELNDRRRLQELCRGIVGQILANAKKYWSADFSDERQSVTSRMFFDSVACRSLGDSFANRIRELASIDGRRESDRTFDLLFSIITGALIARRPETVPPSVIESVECKWRVLVSDELDSLDALAERSQTPWDAHIRGLTPDLPTRLPDWVATTCWQTSDCKKFWNSLTDSLSSADRTTLIEWYAAEAREIAGEEFQPPTWMR